MKTAAAAAITDTYSIDEEETNNSGLGEKTKCNQLIVMDDVSGLDDESKKFASLLIVAHKFNYTCVYIFHTISQRK